MSPRSSGRTPTLATWNATAVAGTSVLAAVITVALVTGLTGARMGPELLLVGLVPVLCATLTAAVLGRLLSQDMRELRRYAVEGVSGRTERTGTTRPFMPLTDELSELAATLDALHVRVRVADDIAGGHRRTAESASAGMYELLSGLVASEEGTRGQLAAELHDTVAQSLVAARGMLAADGGGDLSRVEDLVAEAEDQLRAVMARTRPPALAEGDLAGAVGGLCDDLELRYGLVVTLSWPSDPQPIPLASAVTVYRFFQEALLNVVKHADCDRAEAGLMMDGEGVTAFVRDHGPGFDPSEVRSERGRHVGLGLLRERARLAGGGVSVLSAPGVGTTLTLDLPRGLLAAGRRSPAVG